MIYCSTFKPPKSIPSPLMSNDVVDATNGQICDLNNKICKNALSATNETSSTTPDIIQDRSNSTFFGDNSDRSTLDSTLPSSRTTSSIGSNSDLTLNRASSTGSHSDLTRTRTSSMGSNSSFTRDLVRTSSIGKEVNNKKSLMVVGFTEVCLDISRQPSYEENIEDENPNSFLFNSTCCNII